MDILRLDVESSGTPAGGVFTAPDSFGGAGYNTDPTATITTSLNSSLSFAVFKVSDFASYTEDALRSFKARVLVDFTVKTSVVSSLTVSAYATPEYDSVLTARSNPTTGNINVAFNELTDNQGASLGSLQLKNNTLNGTVDITDAVLKIVDDSESISPLYNGDIVVFFQPNRLGEAVSTNVTNVGLKIFGIIPTADVVSNFGIIVGSQTNIFANVELGSSSTLPSSGDTIVLPTSNPNTKETLTGDFSTVSQVTSRYEIVQSAPAAGTLAGAGLAIDPVVAFQDSSKVGYTFSGTTAQANALIKTLTFTPSSSGGPVSFTLEQYVNAGLPTVLGVSSLYSVADGVSFGGSGQPQSLDILSGAVASNLKTSITAGVSAILNIRNGGQSIGAVVRGGVVNVYDGGVDNAADLSSLLSGSLGRDVPSTENIYSGGLAKSTTLRDASQQIIMSGGLATDTQVQTYSDGSTQQVQAGGSALRTTVFDTGMQIVAGSASATVVKSGGTETVLSGGVADGTSLAGAGAKLVLSDGSKVTNLSTVAGSNVTASGATTVGGITGAGAVAITGGALNLSAASSFAGGVSIASGSLLVAAAPSGVTTLSGVVSGSGGLVKQGAGTLTLSANNTFTGGVSLLAGRLVATTAGSLGNIYGALTLAGGTLETPVDMDMFRAITVNAASAWMVDAGATTTLRGNLGGAGQLTKTGAGVLALVGGDTATGGVVVKEGTLAVGSDKVLGAASSILSLVGGVLEATQSFTSARNITVTSGAVQVDAGARLTLTGVLGGNGPLTKTGAGSLTLSGVNTYSGGTTVSAGLLVVGSDAALGERHGELVLAGGTLETTASFASSRNVKLSAAGTIKVDAGTSLSLTSAVSGSGSLIKAGAGVLTLGPNNSYSGGTTVAAGTLVVSGNGSLGLSSGALTFTGGALETTAIVNSARAVHLQANATLQVDAGATATFSGVLDGAGALTKTGGGALMLSGANSFTGGLILKGGAVDLASAGAAGIGGVVFGDGQTVLTVRGAAGLANAITGFDTDDTLDLKGLAFASGATATLAGGVLTIASGASSETFAHFALASDLAIGQYGLSFALSSDGAGGTSLALSGYGRPPLSGPGGNYTGTTPPPVLTAQPTASVAENTPAGTTVYAVQATGGTGALSFGLSGDDAGKFTIDPATGALKFIASPDFEQPGAADGSNTYHVNVIVSDSVGARATQALALTVTDANDIAPVVISDTSVEVAAGTAAGIPIYTVAATDADTVNGPTRYVLGGHDAGLFNLDAATGALSFRTAPAADQVYDITVQASDGANVSAAQAVEVTVAAAASANAFAPVFTAAATAVAPENVAAHTPVYAATAVDADGDGLSYALSGADATQFTIDPATGELAFKTSPDFERPGAADGSNTYSLSVTATDGAGGHATTQTVKLTVADVNDNAPVVTSAAKVTVGSDAAAGDVVYTASASDADTVNGAQSFSLGGADAGRFTLDAATGALSFKAAPSYANPDDAGGDHVYDITITASDGLNASAAKAVAITVVSADTHAPVFTSAAAVTTPEEASPTTAVYTAQAADADGDSLAYAIAGGADAAKFTIDAATGAVAFISPPDFEAPGAADGSNTYRLVVLASDGLHAVTQSVAIGVTDVADAALPSNPSEGQAEAVINDPATALVKGDVAVAGTLDFTRTGPLTFAGVISGTGSVEKTGGGALTLSGVNTYRGPTNVDGGVLKVNGSIASSPVTVGAGAELGGSGTTGPVTLGAGAAIGPGNSPGTLNTIGDLTLAAGAIYKQEIGGYGAGQFDVINVTGAVKLNGATLNATLYGGFTATTGSSALVIINNDGADPVTGAFAGLAEGATVDVGGRSATISYRGGTGNDVTLTFTAPTPVVTPTPPTQGPAATFTAQFASLLRATAGSADALNPSSPIYAQYQAGAAIAGQLAAGTITQAAAQSALFHLVDGTVSVAALSYAFFTGRTPTSDGLDYLVHSSANPNDLNDPYYLKFGVENRYINFAAALAKGGAGTTAYHAAYDGLSLSDAVTKAYATIFGAAPGAGKVAQILGDLVPDGLGGQETRAQYFAAYGGDGANGVGTKAAAIGFLLADAVKEGVGPYNAAQQHFLTDLSAGSAVFNVDLVGAYAPSTPSGTTMVDATTLH